MKYKTLLTISVIVVILSSVSFLSKVNAQVNPYIPPSNCPEDFTVDVNCQLARVNDPTTDCDILVCKGEALFDEPQVYSKLLQFFGENTLYIDDDRKVAAIINLVVSTFLGIISVFAIIYGVYVAGVKRAKTTDAGEIAAANKTLGTIIIGFILAWSFIFIMQIVFNILGLGSLNELVILGDNSDSSTIVIQ